MRIGGMSFWLDVGRIVVQQIEHVVTLVFVRADDASIDRYVVGHQRIRAHAFLQSEILRRVTGIDGIDLCFDALPVAAGMHLVMDVVKRWPPW